MSTIVWAAALLLAIALPVLIHIISRHHAKVVLLPFVDFLPSTKAAQHIRIWLQQKLLLLLRLALLLSALAIITLDQFNVNTSPDSKDSIVLLSQDWLDLSSVEQKQAFLVSHPNVSAWVLLTRDRKGVSLPRLSWQQIMQWPAALPLDTSIGLTNTSEISQAQPLAPAYTNVWADAALYVASLPSPANVDIYTSDRQSQFVGEHVPIDPQHTHAISWHILAAERPLPSSNTSRPNISAVIIDDQNFPEKRKYAEAALSALLPYGNINWEAKQASLDAPQLIARADEAEWVMIDLNQFSLIQMRQADFVIDLGKLLFAQHNLHTIVQAKHLDAQSIIGGAAGSVAAKGIILSESRQRAAHPQQHWFMPILCILVLILFISERLFSERASKDSPADEHANTRQDEHIDERQHQLKSERR